MSSDTLIQNPEVRALIAPLLSLPSDEVDWRVERWRRHLETLDPARLESLHRQILAELGHYERDGLPESPAPEYLLLMQLHHATAFMSDMRVLGEA